MTCLTCGKQTSRKRHKYCSHICAGKGKMRHHCKFCGKIISAYKKYCSDECKQKRVENVRLDNSFKKKKPNSKSVIEWRQRIKLKAVELKGGKCEICGYNKSLRALQFHHLNPNEKDFGISSGGNTRSWNKVQEELKKCIMVCGNCHDEIHDGIHSQYLIIKEQ